MSINSTQSSTTTATSLLTGGATSGDSAGPLFVSPFATVAIKTYVPMTLDLQASNYNKCSFFRAVCGKFGLLPHIVETVTAQPTDPAWA